MAEADQDVKGANPEPQPDPTAPQFPGSPGQPGDIQTYIGARLRKAFDDVANQPIPDRFLQLMAELDRG